MIRFGKLSIGDRFEFKGRKYKVIETIKSGACGCIPAFNAQSIEDEEIFGFFTMLHKVHKIEVYRTHSSNVDDVDMRTRYVKRIIESDDTLPVFSNTTAVTPSVNDTLVEYEETDTWLLYFGLAVEKKIPYYEKLEGTVWIPETTP